MAGTINTLMPSAHRMTYCHNQLREKFGVKVQIIIRLGQRTKTENSEICFHKFPFSNIFHKLHTKDHHKNGTNCLPSWHKMR